MYDIKKNAIRADGTMGSAFRGTGQLYIRLLSQLANIDDASSDVVNDWQLLKSWLQCKTDELEEADFEKAGLAWQSYMASATPPSASLEKDFLYARKAAKQEEWEIVSIPDEISVIFAKLLSTNKSNTQTSESDDNQRKKDKMTEVSANNLAPSQKFIILLSVIYLVGCYLLRNESPLRHYEIEWMLVLFPVWGFWSFVWIRGWDSVARIFQQD